MNPTLPKNVIPMYEEREKRWISWWVLIVLMIVFFPAAIVYLVVKYFERNWEEKRK